MRGATADIRSVPSPLLCLYLSVPWTIDPLASMLGRPSVHAAGGGPAAKQIALQTLGHAKRPL